MKVDSDDKLYPENTSMTTLIRAVILPILILLLVLSTMTACTYCHQVHNVSDGFLYNVTVRSQDDSFGHGTLGPGVACGAALPMKFKKSSPPRIFWQTEDGTPHEQEVPLSRNPGSRYETHFVIKHDRVQAFFFPTGTYRPPASEFRKFLVEIGVREPKKPEEAARTLAQPCQRPDCPRCEEKL